MPRSVRKNLNRKSQRTKRKQLKRINKKHGQRKTRSNKKQLRRKRRTQRRRKNTLKGGSTPREVPSPNQVAKFLKNRNVQKVTHKAKGQGVRGRQSGFKGKPQDFVPIPLEDEPHDQEYENTQYETVITQPIPEANYAEIDAEGESQNVELSTGPTRSSVNLGSKAWQRVGGDPEEMKLQTNAQAEQTRKLLEGQKNLHEKQDNAGNDEKKPNYRAIYNRQAP